MAVPMFGGGPQNEHLLAGFMPGGNNSNQYFPHMPGMPSPGGTPSPKPGGPPTANPVAQPAKNPWDFSLPVLPANPGLVGPQNLGSGIYTQSTVDPNLTGAFQNFLQSQIGRGTPMNPLLQQLMTMFTGGKSNIPGADTLSTIANKGIDALPEWQKMIAAQQQNIGQNQSNLREQFGSMGALAGSPFGTAMSNYEQQTTLDENSLLAQLQQQNILEGQIPAAQSLFGGAQNFGQFGQSLLPQNNPLNAFMAQQSGSFAPMYDTKKGGGILGGLIPALASGVGAYAGSKMGGGDASDSGSSTGSMIAHGAEMAGMIALMAGV
jgi:hypothetical protein